MSVCLARKLLCDRTAHCSESSEKQSNLLVCFYILCTNYVEYKHKQFFTFHSNRVKCEKQILPTVGFEPTTSCIRGKRLTARPRGPHGRERTTLRLIWNTLKVFFYKGTRQIPSSIGKRLQNTFGIDSISHSNVWISPRAKFVFHILL